MAWTIETIEQTWLGAPAASLALEPREVAEAFSRVEERLGQSWLNEARTSNGQIILGSGPTLGVVMMGQQLAALDGIARSERLIEKIRRRDASARAELEAIYLVRYAQDIEIELEPSAGGRLPDFRAREKGGTWVYVEVTFPDWSKATERAQTVLQRVAELVYQIKKMFSLEVFLRREPDDEELNGILAVVPDFCALEGTQRQELPDNLGLLFLNNSSPGTVITDDHGEEPRPRIGMARAIVGGDEPHRHIAVRMTYSDQRAAAFLDSEASQLPKDAPGLIMIETSRAPGSSRSWAPLFNSQFELQLHNQVSAICLFGGGQVLTPRGMAWLPETKVLPNPHAKFTLPNWLSRTLANAGAEFERVGRS